MELGGRWCIIHERSGKIFTWLAFDHIQQAQCYISHLVEILDWGNSYEALCNMVSKPEVGRRFLEAARAAWAVEVAA